MSEEFEQNRVRDELVRLFSSTTEPVSGERLSEALHMSRTAIWKHIKALERVGFEFESAPRVGYRITRVPDELMGGLVEPYLRKDCQFGRPILFEPERTSTNVVANEYALSGIGHGAVVTTGVQTGGRGRQGRPWQSPTGGMWFSLVVRKPCALSKAADITLLASVAVRRALHRIGADVRIKWPNDILLHDKKVCGILAQMRTDGEMVDYAIVGIGINANFSRDALPSEVQPIATTLQTELGTSVYRPALFADILGELSDLYGQLQLGIGFSSVREEWLHHAHTIGRSIRVRLGETVIEGKAVDVDEQGTLLLLDESGSLQRVHSGEVLFTSDEHIG